MSKIFEDFDIYGIPDSDETCVLASLLTGEPVLFVGPPGTAKTEIIYMIGSSFKELSKRKYPNNPEKWFNFNVYDTSKINFEDLIGWPNPNALKEGKINFIESPTTIWNKDLIGLDELNRCAEDRQANLFEVIRNRTCMGSPTNVKFIFSAINPYGDAGTNNLSSAIVDRHMFFLHFAGFDKMNSDLRKKVIERVGTFDSVGLRHWGSNKSKFATSTKTGDKINNVLADQGERLQELIQEAADAYPIIQEQIGKPVTSLIDTLISRLATEKDPKNTPSISGRRAGMMARAIIAYRAIQLARAKKIGTPPENLKNTVLNSIMCCIPLGIDKPTTPDNYTRIKQIITEVCNYWEKTTDADNASNANVLYDIYYNPDPISKLELLLKHSNISNLVTTKAWKDLAESDLETSSILYYLRNAMPGIIPDHVISKEKTAQVEAYADNCLKTIDLSPACELFVDEFTNLLDIKNHKHTVTYVCAIFTTVRLNKIAKTHEEVQLGLKIALNLITRCTDLIDDKINNDSTQQKI